MSELIEVIRTVRAVGSGQSSEDIVHEHTEFWSCDGTLLAEECKLDSECDYLSTVQPTYDGESDD